MSKINLVPEVKLQQKKLQKTNLISTFVAGGVLVLLLLITFIIVGIKVSYKSNITSYKKDIAIKEKELEKYKDIQEAVISLDNGLKKIDEITKESSKWSAFFTELEKATPKDITFKKIDVQDNKIKADLEGKNVDSIGRFIESFSRFKISSEDEEATDDNKNLFSNIEVDSYTKTGDKVTFSASLEFSKEALWK